MRTEKDLVDQVSNVHTHNIEGARRRLRPTNGKQGILQEPEAPDGNAFPYLEQIVVAAKQHPYAMLAAMISVASIVIVAVVTVAVATFTGAFLMYGTMRDIQAKQEMIIRDVAETKGQVSVIKTLSASTYARQDFMVGLMTKENQERVNAHDRNNPRPLPPALKDEEKKQ